MWAIGWIFGCFLAWVFLGIILILDVLCTYLHSPKFFSTRQGNLGHRYCHVPPQMACGKRWLQFKVSEMLKTKKSSYGSSSNLVASVITINVDAQRQRATNWFRHVWRVIFLSLITAILQKWLVPPWEFIPVKVTFAGVKDHLSVVVPFKVCEDAQYLV